MVLALQRLLRLMPGSIFVVLSHIEIESDDENRLILDADGWLVVFDKVSQIIFCSGKPVASFSSVISIDVAHFINGKRFEWWTLGLELRGGEKFAIGRSTDGTLVSIAAAHAATITGKSVRALRGVGL